MLDDQLYQTPSHIAFADESKHNIGRYRGVALVTLKAKDAEKANQALQCVLRESSITEFKWSKLRSARSRFAALKIVDWVLLCVTSGIARIDAISWDIMDSRHSIPKRSDIRNLRRMYYFLFRNVLGRRWKEECVWELRPDESSFGAASHLGYLGNPGEMNEDGRRVQIARITEVCSEREPLVQVADFFAGIASYSRESYNAYERWQILDNNTARSGSEELSVADIERCRVLQYLYGRCKENKMGVGLKSTRGLRTRDPRRPLNFWWYEPQGDYDEAPKWN